MEAILSYYHFDKRVAWLYRMYSVIGLNSFIILET